MSKRQQIVCVETQREHVLDVHGSLEDLLHELVGCEPQRRSDFKPKVPKVPAIYLLSEDNRNLYVGRTRNLRNRLADHMNPGGDRDSATFAFRLAKEEAEHEGLNIERTGNALEADPEFKPFFVAAKERVSRMHVRYIALADAIEQTLLEVYAAESLATPYNPFETH